MHQTGRPQTQILRGNATFGAEKIAKLDNSPTSGQNARMSQTQHSPQSRIGTGQSCFVRSYAKINLTLDVLGRRSDGYHELVTIMQTVDLYDTICLTNAEDGQVQTVCTRPELNNADNLAARAAQAIRQRLGLTRGLLIELDKRVPVAAGLGGGSGNAAAVLLALRQWWNLPLTAEELHEIAASLGSDVPFFLSGGLALCEGRGEHIQPLALTLPPAQRWLLLLKPGIGVATPAVFRALTARDYSDGRPSQRVLADLQAGRTPHSEDLYNSLEHGVLERYPLVAEARDAMLHAGAPFARLSGSGPTLFSLFGELSAAAQTRQQLQALGYEVYLTRAVYPAEEQIQILSA
jgi:4-diphosphocytidyl-2-C-methyl-D-erythritol kinase